MRSFLGVLVAVLGVVGDGGWGTGNGGTAAVSPILRPQTPVPGAAQREEYDVVIRNGRVLDGQGNPWILADVAIKGGRFARIGKIPERGRTEIDAKGKYVS